MFDNGCGDRVDASFNEKVSRPSSKLRSKLNMSALAQPFASISFSLCASSVNLQFF